MMGNPSEAGMNGVNGGGGYGPGGTPRYREQQKATFSGGTALVGVIALIVDIVAVAVPHWGYYSPLGPGYYSQGKDTKDICMKSISLRVSQSFTTVMASQALQFCWLA